MKKIGKAWFPHFVSECIVWPIYSFALLVGVTAFLIGFALWAITHPMQVVPRCKSMLRDWNQRY